MKRLLAAMILCVMMLTAVSALAEKQKSIPGTFISGGYDGLFIIHQKDSERNYLYDEEGKLVMASPENGARFVISYMQTLDGKLTGQIFVDEKCIKVSVFVDENMKSLYGLISKNGETLCACEYDAIETFTDGIASVKKDNKYGYINTSGQLISKCQWDEAKEFDHGIAVVKKDEKYSLLNKQGKVIGKDYLEVNQLRDGYATVQTSKGWGVINSKGEQVLECKYSNVQLCGNGIVQVVENQKNGNTTSSLMTLKGKTLTKTNTWARGTFNDDLLIVEYSANDGKTHAGAVNKKGKVVLDFGLNGSSIGGFNVFGYNNGMCFLRQVPKEDNANKSTWGFKDKNGKWVIGLKSRKYEPVVYDQTYWLSDKLIKIKNQGIGQPLYGFMNTKGKVVCECEWEDIWQFVDGLARVAKSEKDKKTGETKNLFGYVNAKGEVVIPCKYYPSWYGESQKNGLIVLRDQNNMYTCFTKKGKTILPAEYDNILVGDKVIIALKNEQVLFFDLKGKPIMEEEAPAENTDPPADTGEAA